MELFVLLISVAVASCLSDHELWTDFKTTHAKTYLNKNEEVKRFEIFQQNLREIEEHNAKYNKGETTYYKGVNQFTDLTHSEYLQMLNYNKDSRPIHQNATVLKYSRDDLRDLPESVDWRQRNAVSEVKNQGGCGSCWAFSTTGGLEGQYAIKYGHIVSLSEQNLLDCSTSYGNGDCDQGGLMIYGFNYVKDFGINSEAEYPYETKQANCRYNPSTSVLHISGYTLVDQNEDALKYAVATFGPISVGIDFSLAGGYAGGIFNNPACANDRNHLNHGVLVVGYGSENGIDYWIVKNSWSANFGEQGYIRMIRNANNQCGIVDDASFPQVL